jgi:hypothetical protein
MDDVYDRSVPPAGKEWQLSHGYAAEIRAIARWLEERATAAPEFEPEEMPVVWRLAGMLLAEADRADEGG